MQKMFWLKHIDYRSELRAMLVIGCIAVVVGCTGASWLGKPASMLEIHPTLSESRMIRTKTASGIEARAYSRFFTNSGCAVLEGSGGSGFWVPADAFADCNSSTAACVHLFYIQDGSISGYSARSCSMPLVPPSGD